MCKTFKNFVTFEQFVVANIYFGGTGKGCPGAFAKATVLIKDIIDIKTRCSIFTKCNTNVYENNFSNAHR
jgi:hypothetical protein